MNSKLPSGTITFLFTDIEGSTPLWERYPAAMQAALAKHDALLRRVFETYNGYIFKTVGDAFYVAFASPSDALHAALDAQRALFNQAWGDTPIKARMGLHTGEAEARDSDYFGPPLNRAARLMSAGYGGQILLSIATQELVRDHLPEKATLLDLGEHRLKDLFRPEHIYQLCAPGLPSEFPALRTLAIKRTNLPARATPFIGREREVAAVLGLLRDPGVRLVTLAGPGGTGKTRLSIQAAADLLDDYEHGVWFVDLSPITNPNLVVTEIANTVGVKESSDEPLEKTLLRYLHDRTTLLTLDNYEQVVVAAPVVSHLLAGAPRLKVLVTSREVLQVYGEHSYHVPPLALPNLHRKETAAVISKYEAVSLFIQRAKAVQPSFEMNDDNASAVAKICVRLDGLPLAIELAAARIALFTPQQLLQRLADRLKTVSGRLRDSPARQRTLRGTIDWSYDLLDDDEKTLFARLAVFQGGRSLAAAETVCGEGLGIEVADGLESLIHKSLLRQVSGSADEPRYVMLETIHEYVRERLAARVEADTIRTRYVEYFAQLAERAEPEVQRGGYKHWQLILNDEQDNILAALEWALGGGAVEAGVRLTIAIGVFWFAENRSSLNNLWTTRALQYQAVVPRAVRARLLLAAGSVAWSTYDMAHARQFEQQALALFRALGNSLMTARTLIYLAGTTIGDPASYAQAEAWLDEALALAHQLGEANLEALVLNVLGEVARSMGDYATAKKAYADCLRLTRRTGNRWREAMILGNFSRVYAHQGDHHRALDFARQHLQLGLEINSVTMIAGGLNLLARALGLLGRPAKAACLYGASEILSEQLGARIQAGDLADYERGLVDVRAMLDPAQFNTLWAEGRAMEMEQAIAYALAEG